MKLRRYEDCGAVFTEDLSSLKDLDDRGITHTGIINTTTTPWGKGLEIVSQNSTIQSNQKIESDTYSVMIRGDLNPSGSNKYIFDFRQDSGTGYFYSPNTTTLGASSGTIYVNGVASSTIASGFATYIVSGITLESITGFKLLSFNSGLAAPLGIFRDFIIFRGTLTPKEITDLTTGKTFDYSRVIWNEYNISGDPTYAPLDDTQKTNISNNKKSDGSTLLGLTTIQLNDFGDGARW